MNVSRELVQHLVEFEGMVLHLYNDPSGNCTVGVGHLLHLGECDGRANEQPFRDGLSEEDALRLLGLDTVRFEEAVEELIDVQLTQSQFDALVSFAFNVGVGALERSDLRRRLNAGEYWAVCRELLRWVHGSDGRELAGLVRRRRAECEMFQRTEVVDVARLDDLEREVRDGQHAQNVLLVGAYAAIDLLSEIAVWCVGELIRLGATPPRRADLEKNDDLRRLLR